MPDYDVQARITVRAPDDDAAINEVARRLRGPVARVLEGSPPTLPIYPVATFNVVEREAPPRGWTERSPRVPA